MSPSGNITPSADRSQTIFHLRQAFKLALSMVLLYWLALSQNWDVPIYGGLAIVIISLGTSGATIEKGIMRFVGTTVGVGVGFLILGLFNHDRWATMLALSAYITVMTYFMQTSRFPYAWYASGFIPLVVWGDNYPHFETAFYFGTFRYLETTVGILIYTTVDLMFWPRRAGDRLIPLGRDLWTEVRERLKNCRERLEDKQLPEGASEVQANLAGTLSRTISTLQDALADTPTVRNERRVWEAWRYNARTMVDALQLWQESIDDCRELDLDRLLPELGPALVKLDKRLERIATLWQQMRAADNDPEPDDGLLMNALPLKLNQSACADLSHGDRAAITSFVGQLEILDRASRELLRTIRVLAGLEASRGFRISSPVRDFFRPSSWDPGRLINALFPPATFIVGFFFWVLVYPPPGPAVPMMAAVFAIIAVMSRSSQIKTVVSWLLSMILVIAPIYFVVMPALSTGFGLLSLIFVYSFVFGFLGGRRPVLKSAPMIMFVLMTGIGNQQSYSFEGLVNGALMIILAGSIMAAVSLFFTPLRPEQALLRSLRRFFHGSGRIMRGFASAGPSHHSRRLRKRYLESMVLPATAKIQSAQKTLDYKLYPDNGSEKVQRLHDSVQSIAYRLESLAIAHERVSHHSADVPESLARVCRQMCEILQRVFQRWESLESGDEFQQLRGSLQQLSRDLNQQLDTLTTGRDRDLISDQMLTDFYTMLGSVRGLIAAMATAQGVISQINWPQWADTRF